MLEIKDLSVGYGHIEVLHNISMTVNKGEIVCIIGANGAGKTTLLNTISGFIKRERDAVRFEGRPLATDVTRVTKERIIHVPEGRKIFPNITVQENLILGGYITPNNRVKQLLEEVYALFPRLKERQKQRAGTLSGGEQQMLAIGRGLMAEPRMMLLDEPSLGIAPIIVKEIFDFLKERNRAAHLTMLLVEQNANMAFRISDRAYILENGRFTMHGPADEISKNEKVMEAYFGNKTQN